MIFLPNNLCQREHSATPLVETWEGIYLKISSTFCNR